MGDTQVGGNLSVHWLINADDVHPSDEGTFIGSRRVAPGRREWVQHGADHHRNSDGCGKYFTVRIKLPEDAETFLASVRKGLDAAREKGRLEFELVIEKADVAHTQIQITWGPGRSVPWSDGLGQLASGNSSQQTAS